MGLHQDDDLLGDGSREAVLGELAADREHLAAVEALDPGRPVGGGPVRARPRAPQPAPGDLRHRRPAPVGASFAGARHDRRRPLPAVRPRPRSAGRAAVGDLRPARGGRHVPRGGQDPGDRAAGPALAAARARIGRRDAGLLRRDRGRRRGRPRARSTSAGSSAPARPPRSRSSCTGRGWRARCRTGRTTGRSAASATTRWSRCAASTGSMPTRSSSSAGSASTRSAPRASAAAREIDPDADEATVVDRVKSDQPADLRAAPSRPIGMPWPGPASSSSTTTS